MKLQIALLLCLFTFMACQNSDSNNANNESQDTVQQETPAATPPAAQPAAPTQAPQTAEPAQNASGVWHFICPKGCKDGAGSAIACAHCGETLVHNQGYHAPPHAQ